MSDCMLFPDTVEEFMERYKAVDTDGIYMSKGAELVPIFRMRQWFEHLPSAQPTQSNAPNTLDAISRQAAIDALTDYWHGIENRHKTLDGEMAVYCDCKNIIKNLPSAQLTQNNRVNSNNALDTISRQTAMDAFYKYPNVKWTTLDVLEYINDLPPAQPEPYWIPCGERLPEEAGWYLCTYKDGRVNTKYWSKDKGWVDNIRLHMFELYDIRSRLTKEKVKLAEESIYWDDWVVAWSQLPESYKGD